MSGCSGGSYEEKLDDYLQRLARPIEQHAAVATPETTAPPRAEALRLPIEAGNLDGLDFLRLRGCALQQSVAKRNSSLGMVAPPSQRLLLELSFLREAPPCIEKLEDEKQNELAGLLRENVKLKQGQLPALIFNATLGSREYRDFWRANEAPANYPQQTSSAVVTALERITADTQRWLSGDYAADEAAFELALGAVAMGDGGEMLAALTVQAAYLQAGDSAIDARLEQGPLCKNGIQPASAPVLRTVAQKFFVGRVQSVAAILNQRHQDIRTPIERLEEQLTAVIPTDYAQWRLARNALLEKGLAAPKQHVRSLQSLLGACYAAFERKPADPGR